MNEPPTSEILIVKENVAHETNQNVIGRTEIDGIANYAIHTQSGTWLLLHRFSDFKDLRLAWQTHAKNRQTEKIRFTHNWKEKSR